MKVCFLETFQIYKAEKLPSDTTPLSPHAPDAVFHTSENLISNFF